MNKTTTTDTAKENQELELKPNACLSCGESDWRMNHNQVLGIGHYKVSETCRYCGLTRTREEDLY